MRHIITISIILVSFISRSAAQTEFDLKLVSLEQEVYQAHSDSDKAAFILKKVDLYINNQIATKAAFNEVQRINYNLLRDGRDKTDFLWNASLLAHLNDDRDYARFYLNRYVELSGDTGINSLLLRILINNGQDSADLRREAERLSAYNDEFKCLSCLNEVAYYNKRHRKAYLAASAILPGLGSMLEGYPLKGATSTVINAACGLAIYELLRSNLYVNAALWGATFVAKFYIGNIRLTEKLFYAKESGKKNILAASCEDKIGNLLKKYPLDFK